MSILELPSDLRQLVREMTDILGESIIQFEGQKFYEKVESYRIRLKELRQNKDYEALRSILEDVKKEKPQARLKLAHSFSLLMELINCCEAAYRTWRLQSRSKTHEEMAGEKIPLNFVLTSHPTEARSPLTVKLTNELIGLLTSRLQHPGEWSRLQLETRVRQMWKIPLSKTKKPDVKEEAEFIFNLVFREEILQELLREDRSYEFRLRTWVGGDKDGHPGVNEKVMLSCLSLSRKKLVQFVRDQIQTVQNDLRSMGETSKPLLQLKSGLKRIQNVGPGDGDKLKRFHQSLKQLKKSADPFVRHHGAILTIEKLLHFSPGLVLPIELREDSGENQAALENKSAAIAKMLTSLSKVSRGGDIRNYAKGFVVSHCESAKDIENAVKLSQKCTAKKTLPVVPLFESGEALVNGAEILSSWLSSEKNKQLVKSQWDGKLEVMLGYSDSAKQTGVLASRRLIQKSMGQMEKVLKGHEIRPIFFHGSGGSVARGGGSLREQIVWWPNSAVHRPKMTIQGEMIQRTFASVEILSSQAQAIAEEASRRQELKSEITESAALDELMMETQKGYRKLVEDKEFLSDCLAATPFEYLQVLKIGSRPPKRAKEFSLSSLRAIPWVLCWTQTRILMPTWWGLGSAWQHLDTEKKEELKALFKEDSFFSSFVKTIGFSLAKVELPIWQLYLERVHGAKAAQLVEAFSNEHEKARDFVVETTGQENMLWYRPWLGESIRLRAPYIHLLNLLQMVAMDKRDEELLRKSIVGIASGMLTTG